MYVRRPFRDRLTHWKQFQRRWFARCGRSVVVVAMLGCYLMVLGGLPLPGPLASREVSRQPYPCQGGTCGCQSAQQCWRNCCCYTDREKWEWAERHQVTPPASFLKRVAALGLLESDKNSRSCCASDDAATSACAVAARDVSPAPLKKQDQGGSCCRTDGREVETSRPLRVMVTIDVMKCRGLGTHWIGLSDCVPAVSFQFRQAFPLVQGSSIPGRTGLPEISFPPPLPPPREPTG